MKIQRYVLGELATNCYLLIDEASGEAAIVDPADEAERLQHAVEDAGVTLRYILLTHGHRDHTLAAPRLHELFPDAEVYIHAADKGSVGMYSHPMDELIGDALKFYGEGDTLPLGGLTLEVLHTPGHTGGSVCLKCVQGDSRAPLTSGSRALFTGDTLFAGSMGRVDLPGAQPERMFSSLGRLARMEGEYDVLPGHGETSTLSHERQYNLYLRML